LFLNFQQAGKKKRGCGGNEFLPACFRAVGAVRVGSGSFLHQQGSKARKISFNFLEGARKNLFQLRNEILRALSDVRRRAAGVGIPRAPHQSKARCGINSASGNLPFFRNF